MLDDIFLINFIYLAKICFQIATKTINTSLRDTSSY